MIQEPIVTTQQQFDQEQLEKHEGLAKDKSSLSPGRRRLIQGVGAAPILMVSGRSALACNPDTDKCALSPMAWMSVHPNNKTATVQLSHTVGCNFLGRSPGYWTPNKSGKTFQGPWPIGVTPFTKLEWYKRDGRTKKCTSTKISKLWNPANWNKYYGLPFNDDCNGGQDVGWMTGSRLPFGSDPRSISRILIDEAGTELWHFCAAYLNVLTYPGQYALTMEELTNLFNSGTLVPGGRKLYSSEIKAFLDQTWA